jgi:hypothetical protein
MFRALLIPESHRIRCGTVMVSGGKFKACRPFVNFSAFVKPTCSRDVSGVIVTGISAGLAFLMEIPTLHARGRGDSLFQAG